MRNRPSKISESFPAAHHQLVPAPGEKNTTTSQTQTTVSGGGGCDGEIQVPTLTGSASSSAFSFPTSTGPPHLITTTSSTATATVAAAVAGIQKPQAPPQLSPLPFPVVRSRDQVYSVLSPTFYPSLPPSSSCPIQNNDNNNNNSCQTIRDFHSSIYTPTFRLAFELGRRSPPQVTYKLHLTYLGEILARIKAFKASWGQIAVSGGIARAFEEIEALVRKYIDHTTRAVAGGAAAAEASTTTATTTGTEIETDTEPATVMMDIDEMTMVSLGLGESGKLAKELRGVVGVQKSSSYVCMGEQ
ncbi:hypothetical protein DL770_010708 [Monosporascus sp. CRB-9-2]|nr:hypothetical protein DL770_010708 [Monosporascus sp. CRB-9-2]